MWDFDSLPDLARENVLKYLAGERDVKACRLVCKEWYKYFDRPAVRSKEHFNFDGLTTCSANKINEVMLRYRGSGVNVVFICVPLDELQFQDFGDKIRGIRVELSSVSGIDSGQDKEALVNMLTHTLNITYFYCLQPDPLISNPDREQVIEQNMLPEVITELRGRNLSFNDLRQFDTTPALLYPPVLYEIFPRLQSLRSRRMFLHQIVRSNLPIKEDLTEIGKIDVLVRNLRCSENERNFLRSLPKLKKLDIGFQFDSDSRDHWRSSLNTCLDIFTRQTELETLRVTVKCSGHYNPHHLHAATGHEDCTKCGHDYNAAKRLSFHILQNCANLKVLHLKLRCKKLRFSEADLQEFVRLISLSKIKDLTFPLNVLERAAFRSHFASLPLESLKLHALRIGHECSDDQRLTAECCEALSALLHTNKILRRMKIQTTERLSGELAHEDTASTTDGPGKLNLRNIIHHRLERLVIDFQLDESVEGPLWLEYLMSWELPRLSSLQIGNKFTVGWLFRLVDAGAIERFTRWIRKMPLLEILNLNFWWLSLDEVSEICKPQPKLRVLSFANGVSNADLLVYSFEVLRNLQNLETVWYNGYKFTRNMFRPTSNADSETFGRFRFGRYSEIIQPYGESGTAAREIRSRYGRQ